MKFRFPLIAILLLMLASVVGAQQKRLLSPMLDYKEKVIKEEEFGTYTYNKVQFFCGFMNNAKVKCTQNDPGFDKEGRFVAEGKVAYLDYVAINKPAGKLAVFRNIDNAIKKAGGRELTYQPGPAETHIYLLEMPQRKTWVVLTNLVDAHYWLTYIESKPMQQVVNVNDDKQKYMLSPMLNYKEKVLKEEEFGAYTYNNLQFFCGLMNNAKVKCTQNDPGFDKEGRFVAEGKVAYLDYVAINKPAGTLAVFRNIDNAIKKAGGRELTYQPDPAETHIYLLEMPQRKTWVVLTNLVDAHYWLTYIESKPMQQVVNVNELEDEIAKSGFATLYINFDTNKFNLPADAAPSIDEVVKLLKKQSGLRLSVEGHTDNVGAAAANKTLSQNRADSVMKAIVAGGIDASRLKAKGYGSEAPIADNRTEDGRAKNRRVELVKAQ
ncbi:MAG: OmpA family protein [Burkholderiaceae bacterium]|jgi:outer membrane protein OmpA-like peptidoglycan-associated protein|nr:OmpA family protein [Burkholderiaceae bacterium]